MTKMTIRIIAAKIVIISQGGIESGLHYLKMQNLLSHWVDEEQVYPLHLLLPVFKESHPMTINGSKFISPMKASESDDLIFILLNIEINKL